MLKKKEQVQKYIDFFNPLIINETDETNKFYNDEVKCKLAYFTKKYSIHKNINKIKIHNLFPFLIYKLLKNDNKLKCSIDYIGLYEKFLKLNKSDIEYIQLRKFINMIYGMQFNLKNNVKFNFNVKNGIYNYLSNFHDEFDFMRELIFYDIDIFYLSVFDEHKKSILEKYFDDKFDIEKIDMLIYLGPKKYIELKDKFVVSYIKGLKINSSIKI